MRRTLFLLPVGALAVRTTIKPVIRWPLQPYRSVVSARDDEIVPFAFTERLSRTLQADFHGLYRGGHFLESDGFERFPLVYRETAAMLTE